MHAQRSKGMRWGVAGHVGLALLSITLLTGSRPASAQALSPIGIV